MTAFLTLLLITFFAMTGACLLINFSKRRAGRTSHALTGMCHETGGQMCSCCSSKITKLQQKIGD